MTPPRLSTRHQNLQKVGDPKIYDYFGFLRQKVSLNISPIPKLTLPFKQFPYMIFNIFFKMLYHWRLFIIFIQQYIPCIC